MTMLRRVTFSRETSGMQVLLVRNPDSPVCERMRDCVSSLGLPLVVVGNCRTAREFLRQSARPMVVLTTVTLPDGNWCGLLNYIVQSNGSAGLVLYSQSVDERLWSEAIWRGAADVLVAPFDKEQVRSCIESVSRALSASHEALLAGA
jgi:DNA-binding NtrC family response regulator